MCDENTGDCYHDGPIAAGGPCTDSVECANDGFCFSEEEYGVLGGYCGDFKTALQIVYEGFGCEDFGRFSMCTVNLTAIVATAMYVTHLMVIPKWECAGNLVSRPGAKRGRFATSMVCVATRCLHLVKSVRTIQ